MPIENSAQRIEYLKSFCSSIGADTSAQTLSGWFNNIQTDLLLITNLQVRAEAMRLFEVVKRSPYLLERAPDQFSTTIKNALGDLIAFLETNDH